VKSARQLTLFAGDLAALPASRRDGLPAARPAPLTPPTPPTIEEPVDEEARRAARLLATDLVLRAGAGTGKTHTLVSVVAHLAAGVTRLGRRVPLPSILMLTFSEKAAGELRDRVRRRLGELAAEPRADAALEQAYARTGAAPVGADGWRAALRALGATTITTFHGFAAGLLRRHAATLGLDPGFAILDEDDAEALLDQVVREVALAALETSPGAASLVRELDFARGIGGRGRGLVEHVAELVGRLREEGRTAADLLGVGDDANAALASLPGLRNDYLDSVDAMVAALAGRAAAGIVARHRELVELRPGVRAALASAGAPLEDPLLVRVHQLTKGSLGTDARREAQGRLRAAEAALTSAHVAVRAEPLHAALVAIVGAAADGYQAAKRARGVLDFGDLMTFARDLLATDAGARVEEQARHAAVLVDEFQDTNGLQDELLALVRAPEAPLLVVGDPKQSIYEFRGADVAVFDRVAARVQSDGGQALALVESRRGRAPLVAFVNRLFARALRGGDHAFELAWVQARDALAAHRGGTGACVELLDPGSLEARAVARRIRALVDGGEPLVGDPTAPRPARWGDVAILLRRFTHLDLFLEELRRAGVPHYVVNGRGFYEAQEVRDLVHALTLLDDPDDALALLGVLRSPLVGLSDAALAALAILARGAGGRRLRLAPLLDPDFAPPAALDAGARDRLAAFVTLFRRLRAHADRLGAAGVLRLLVDETDLRAVLATTYSGEQRVANLEQLLAQAASFDDEGAGDRRTLVRRLRAQMARERSLAAPAQVVGEREDVVRIMTVHQSKGLEFPVVFVPECGAPERDGGSAVAYDREAGLGFRLRVGSERVASPRAARADEVRKLRARAESLRLFYVAATRARDRLVLLGEPGKGWRKEIDGLLEDDAGARDLVRRVSVEAAPALVTPVAVARATAGPVSEPQVSPAPATVDASAALARIVRPPATTARLIVAPVTELADFAACPRRYHLRHEVGLGEFPTILERTAEEGSVAEIVIDASGDDAPAPILTPGLDAAARGTLAHRLLEVIDFAAWAERGASALRPLVIASGHDPDAPDVARVCRQVGVFLEGPFGRSLAGRAGGDVSREVPFAFHVGGEGRTRLLVKGQMDLVVRDGDELTLLDYKLVRDVPEGAYRDQLLTYAAAARALWRPSRLRVGLVLLGAHDPAPRLFDVDDGELDETQARLAQLAGAMARARQRQSYDGRPLATCRALGCGYRVRCHDDDGATEARC